WGGPAPSIDEFRRGDGDQQQAEAAHQRAGGCRLGGGGSSKSILGLVHDGFDSLTGTPTANAKSICSSYGTSVTRALARHWPLSLRNSMKSPARSTIDATSALGSARIPYQLSTSMESGVSRIHFRENVQYQKP